MVSRPRCSHIHVRASRKQQLGLMFPGLMWNPGGPPYVHPIQCYCMVVSHMENPPTARLQHTPGVLHQENFNPIIQNFPNLLPSEAFLNSSPKESVNSMGPMLLHASLHFWQWAVILCLFPPHETRIALGANKWYINISWIALKTFTKEKKRSREPPKWVRLHK